MSGSDNTTLFLRLEGPLQAWGDNSKYVVRRTLEAPTKSGIVGLICCAMGLNRQETVREPIASTALRTLAERLVPEKDVDDKKIDRTVLRLLNKLQMGVRIDRAGVRWWDYHTVGAKVGLLQAKGGIKRTGGSNGPIETLISRREYLCDASFLVALRGDGGPISEVANALAKPKWSLFLGRRSCPPCVPILVTKRNNGNRKADIEDFKSLELALESRAWYPRTKRDTPRDEKRKPLKKLALNCLVEWPPRNGEIAPADAEVWYDAPASFNPPVHEPRLVQRKHIQVLVGVPIQNRTLPPPRPRADYNNTEYKKRRQQRLESDYGLCVFCKSPATTVQHVTYRRAGGNEEPEDLRGLCRLCHDSVTMIEYGLGMGMDRINPEEPCWRSQIIRKRQEIIDFRSLETRRRHLKPEEVE